MEHEFRMICAGIPYALPQGHEDSHVPASTVGLGVGFRA